MHVSIEKSCVFIIRSGYKNQRNEIINSTENLKKKLNFFVVAKGLSSSN